MESSNREPARVAPAVRLLDYQREDVESTARFRWNCWARQTGKSFTKSLRRILRGLDRGRDQLFLSAGERQGRELMEKARQHCQAMKIAFDSVESGFFKDLSIKQLEILLPRGVRIIALPANPQTVRGFTGDVLLDEFAMHAFDREIWAAMLPTVLRSHGELDVASTPRGKGNVFFQLANNEDFARSTITIHDAVASGLDVDVDAMRRAMDDDTLFRQEFLCEFLDEATAFLTYEQIRACCDPSLTTATSASALSKERRELFVGVDIGRHRDLTVMWVLAAEGELLVTAGRFEMTSAPFREQFDLLSELLRLRQVRRCCIDAGGLGMQLAEQAVERFGSHRVEPVVFTPALKSQIAGGLRIAVEAGRIRIPDDERVVSDWHCVQRTMTEAGHFRLAAPRREGSHADRFWAAALAVHAADASEGTAEARTVRPLRYARRGAW